MNTGLAVGYIINKMQHKTNNNIVVKYLHFDGLTTNQMIAPAMTSAVLRSHNTTRVMLYIHNDLFEAYF